MEMPMDVLNKGLGRIRDNGDIDFDNTMAALDIDIELQEKFVFFPYEELVAVPIEEDRGQLHAGSGPEHCACSESENPQWLYNHAVNALALWWKLVRDQEAKDAEHEKRAQRPEPGIYSLNTGRAERYLVAVTADRRIIDLKHEVGCSDFTDTFDGLEDKARWTFTLIETGLGA